jgi:hypothetical protein
MKNAQKKGGSHPREEKQVDKPTVKSTKASSKKKKKSKKAASSEEGMPDFDRRTICLDRTHEITLI